MPFRYKKSVRTTQPQQGTLVGGSPLASALIHAYATPANLGGVFNSGKSAVNGVFTYNAGLTGASWRAGAANQYLLFDDTLAGGFVSSCVIPVGDASGNGGPSGNIFSIQCKVRISVINGSVTNTIFGTFSEGVEFRLNASGNVELLHANVASIGTSILSLSAGVDYDIGCSYDGTIVSFYINGKLSGTTSNAQTFAKQSCFMGSKSADGTAGRISNNSRIYYLYIWDRTRTADEFAAVANNPWQLFAPQRFMLPNTAAATGIPVLSAANLTSITNTTAIPQVVLTF